MKTLQTAKKVATTLALATLFVAGSAAAQTGTSSTSTPGTPNTGTGVDVANILLLTGSAAAVLLGGAYLARRREGTV